MGGNGAATGLCLQLLEFKQLHRIVFLGPIRVANNLRFKVPTPSSDSNRTIIGRCGYNALKLDAWVWRAESPEQRAGDLNPIH
jgi:hypothetical protein